MTNIIQFPRPSGLSFTRTVTSDDLNIDSDYDGTYVYEFNLGTDENPVVETCECDAPDEWSAFCKLSDVFSLQGDRLIRCGWREPWFTYSVHNDEYDDDGEVPVEWSSILEEVTRRFLAGYTEGDLISELVTTPPETDN